MNSSDAKNHPDELESDSTVPSTTEVDETVLEKKRLGPLNARPAVAQSLSVSMAASRQLATSPIIQVMEAASRQLATSPIIQVMEATSRQLATSPIIQVMEAASRQLATSPIIQVMEATSRQLATSPIIQVMEATSRQLATSPIIQVMEATSRQLATSPIIQVMEATSRQLATSPIIQVMEALNRQVSINTFSESSIKRLDTLEVVLAAGRVVPIVPPVIKRNHDISLLPSPRVSPDVDTPRKDLTKEDLGIEKLVSGRQETPWLILYDYLITNSNLRRASRKLFSDGHYTLVDQPLLNDGQRGRPEGLPPPAEDCPKGASLADADIA